MQDLRLVAANEGGTHLVLRSPDGDKFVVPIDERLRAAIRGDKTLLSQLDVGDGQLRPKEIQARIRSGESAEQVARAAGIHVDRVRRFEGPVLAEREHMAQMSQRAAVRRPGQAELRPNTLGESLPPQLAELGLTVAELSWDSWRRDDNRWVVQVEYPHDGLTQQATFLFDPRARTAVAENEQARFLTGELDEHPARAPFKPRIATALPMVSQSESDLDETDEDDDEIQPSALVRRPDPTMSRRPVDVVARRPGAVPAPSSAPRPATLVAPPAPAPMVVPPMPSAAPPMPVPAVAQASVPEPAPRRVVIDTPTLPMEAPVPVETEQAMPVRRTGTHDASADEVRQATPSPSPSRASGRRRASVPSWDDILIGTRPKD
ncbi:septation protein SepH [Sporichthya sp.]|uniref:septation protein SepH n=1 Tax=Sporichthya sp. TaxID=65475 RepID=UPI0017A87DD8|nr:septation protein SepH [Sporichthya sp.]MBA3745189.1 DUF3071 domain-containing protein [Sporichthya sp.]